MNGLIPGLLNPQQQAMAEQRARQSGLLGLGFGLLQASQGQPGQAKPRLGQIVGQAGPMGVQAYQSSFDDTLKQLIMAQQMQEMQRKQQQEAAQQEALQRLVSEQDPSVQARVAAFPGSAESVLFPKDETTVIKPGEILLDKKTNQPIFTAPEQTSATYRDYQKAVEQGYSGTYLQYQEALNRAKASSTVVQVGAGRTGPIPTGQELREDPTTGALTLVDIPGGPAEQQRRQEQQAAQARGETVTRAGQTLIRDTTTAIQTLDKYGRRAAGVGSILSAFPETAAAELQRDIDSIKGNIAIDSLLKIKESGAGLGAIPQAQLEALAGLLGSLDTRMTPSKLKANLQDIQKLYKEIVEKEGGDPFKLAIQRGWSPDVSESPAMGRPRKFNPATGRLE